MDDFTKAEKEVIYTMFNHMFDVISLSDDSLTIYGDTFNRNDLYKLAEKLGVTELIN